MVKSLIILITALSVITAASIFELVYFNSKMEYFDNSLSIIIEQTEQGSNTSQNIKELSDWWKNEKKILNIFVPHNDMLKLDELLVEAQSNTENLQQKTALTSLKKLQEQVQSLPENYSFCIGNIF